ncbi:N-methylhydantoinase B [Edaphobacter modestus]|uniref:N-methylhydantoinase B n=1 Tax=Edaphobacter modestus TaxID=388466 RepID=A0A4Q7YR17_9BACT|nr:N-methylhydantoinase B [Edaphobacter modestus]
MLLRACGTEISRCLTATIHRRPSRPQRLTPHFETTLVEQDFTSECRANVSGFWSRSTRAHKINSLERIPNSISLSEEVPGTKYLSTGFFFGLGPGFSTVKSCIDTHTRQLDVVPTDFVWVKNDHSIRRWMVLSILQSPGQESERLGIKERRDYSCAVFDRSGQVIAMRDHVPAHLGSMPMSVRAARQAMTLRTGDVAILNDPYNGGTHLPDITMVLAVFVADQPDEPQAFLAVRAHHADVGGLCPGSMGLCREIYQKGLRIPPIRLVESGVLNESLLTLLLNNVRTPDERRGDLMSQVGACRVGELRVQELFAKFGLGRTQQLAIELLDYSERLMRTQLAQVQSGSFSAEDFLDSDGFSDTPLRIGVVLHLDADARTAVVSFEGCHPQVQSSISAFYSITYSAVYYVMRCLLSEDAPATAGLMRPITVLTEPRTIVDAALPATVAEGNVETSQRIVDVLLRALSKALPNRVPAASSGTMNNLTIGGIDPRTGDPSPTMRLSPVAWGHALRLMASPASIRT